MRVPPTFKASSSDPAAALKRALEPGEVLLWAQEANTAEKSQFVVGVAVAAAFVAAIAIFGLGFGLRWWWTSGTVAAGCVAIVALAAAVMQRPPSLYAVTSRRLLLIEPRVYFGVDTAITAFGPADLPPGGTIRERRSGSDLCLRFNPHIDGPDEWMGLKGVSEPDRVEALLAELQKRGAAGDPSVPLVVRK